MSALHIERSSANTLGSYIKPIIEEFSYSLAALSLYAIPMGIAYFIFQVFFK